MVGPLPHTSEIQEMAEEFLGDALKFIQVLFGKMKATAEFRQVFKVCLATTAVLSKLGTRNMRPPLKAAQSIIRRVPVLVGTGQIGAAGIALRRFSELLFWTVYFTEHPVEWAEFESNPFSGYQQDKDLPIAYCAHRECGFYAKYAQERMGAEPSGLGVKAVDELRMVQKALNSNTHPGDVALGNLNGLPFDDVNQETLNEFCALLRSVVSPGCILTAAFAKARFDQLPPAHRAFFDWLVGSDRSKTIRRGSFGLKR